jgi:SAM-dependent methyltransferase
MHGVRVLDLGSAHGLYSLEFARRGADSLGLEGRSAWVKQANAARDAHGLKTAQFIQGDAREISLEALGRFDVSLCLGLLYHLEANEAFSVLTNLYEMTSDFVVLDTQVALTPAETRVLGGKEYHGHNFPEHAPGTSTADMEAELGASLDSNYSFWFTMPSLMNLLGDIGFSTVFELKWPTDHMYKDGEFRVHEDYATLIAIKGQPVSDIFGLAPGEAVLERSPEDRSNFLLQRPWSVAKSSQAASTVSDEVRTEGASSSRKILLARIAAMVCALRRGVSPSRA